MLTVDGYVIRQVALPMLWGLGVLMALFTAFTAANLLRDTVSGDLPVNQVVLFLAIRGLIALEVLLPTAFYFSVVTMIAAWHRDREAHVFYAAGVSPLRTTRAVWVLAILVALAVGVLCNVARPWSYRSSYELTARSEDLTVDSMQPGRYYRWRETFVIAAEIVRPEAGILEKVFVQERRDDGINVIRSRTGRIAEDGSAEPLWFLFKDGTSYQIDTVGNVDRTSDFQSLYYRPKRDQASPGTKRRARPSEYLSRSKAPKEVAEFQWRIAMPVVSFLLGIIGVQLARAHPGRTPYVRFLVAIVIYAAVFNLTQIARIAVESEQISTFPGVYIVPFAIAVIHLAVVYAPRLLRRGRSA